MVAHGAFSANGSAAVGTAPQSYAFWTGTPPTDVTVSIKLRTPPTASTYYGVTARANPSVPDRDHYAAYVDPDGYLGLARRDDYAYFYLGYGPLVSAGTHTLSLSLTGTSPVQLSVELDGAVVIQATDASPLPAGKVGVFDYEGLSQPLDDFTVTPGG
jgi:hypothetical protein